jgi:hypothetical protein
MSLTAADRSSESGLTVVNVTNGSDVDVRLTPLEFFLSHSGMTPS